MTERGAREAVVVGAGIIGLSAATRLLADGWRIRIWAADDLLDTVSSVAAALWYPYRIFPVHRVQEWSAVGLRYFTEQARNGAPGVRLSEGRLLWRGEQPAAVAQIPQAHPLQPLDIPAGYSGGCLARLPVIEMPVYLRYLESCVRENGGTFHRRRVDSFGATGAVGRVVINCSGLGARALCGDESVHPVRGQVVLTTNPGLSSFVVDVDAPQGATYAIARSNDCVLGGTADENDWNMKPDPGTADAILARCRQLEPRLSSARVTGHRVGLRPGRPEVRLEVEQQDDLAVIHNYGHGGAGVTVAWGCADEVVRLADAIA